MTLQAPFPYFGGKSKAAETVWQAFGVVDNYVEPFAGSAAMLLGAPDGERVETINDADGFVANFWRAISYDPAAVAHHADWPCNEIDLFARHGITALFLDPPYTKGNMDYAAGGVGTTLPMEVQAWCADNGQNPALRIVLCGHAGEHDALLQHGWHTRTWTALSGYARSEDAVENYQSETLWCSPHCLPEKGVQVGGLFD
jgi:hypothetical protein